MTTTFAEIKKKAEEVNGKLDKILNAHKHLEGAFNDATQNEKIKHDLDLKNGSGADAKPKMGGSPVEDGAEGTKIKGGYGEKSGSGTSGKILEGQGPSMEDGAKTDKVKKIL